MQGYNNFPNSETWFINETIINDTVTYKKLRDSCLNKPQKEAVRELRKYFTNAVSCAGPDPKSDLFADRFVIGAMDKFFSRVNWDSIYDSIVKKADLEFMQ